MYTFISTEHSAKVFASDFKNSVNNFFRVCKPSLSQGFPKFIHVSRFPMFRIKLFSIVELGKLLLMETEYNQLQI